MKSLTQIVGIACAAAVALVLSGCATVMHTSTQAVTVRSEPPGAKVYVNDVDTGQTTPTSIRLERGEQGTTLRVEREGVRPATIKLRRSVSGWVAGNAILGPLAPGGIAADYFNGAAYKLTPEAVLVAFPDPATTPNPLTRVPQVTSSGVQPVLRDSASWFYMVAGVGGMLGRRPDADCPIPDRDSGFGASYGASFLKGKHLISIRALVVEESKGGSFFTPPRVLETAVDLGVLYGRARRGSAGLASASVGLGMVVGERWCRDGGWLGTETFTEFATVGIPVQVQLHPKALSRFGFGIFGMGNLNPKRSFASVALGFSVGLLR